jgi:hypothetical protein
MKLSKIYSLKKSKSEEIISSKFSFINIRYRKTTHWVDDSPTQRVDFIENLSLKKFRPILSMKR